MTDRPFKDDTLLGHAGNKPRANFGIVNPPVYHASTILFPSLAAVDEMLKDKYAKVSYGRFGTPTTFALEEAVAAVEGADKAIALPSGQAAAAGALLSFLKAGDHLLMTDSVYGPVRAFCDMTLKDLNIETTYYDPLVGGGIAALIRPNTRVVYLESPGSLTFEVQDVPAIAAAARAAGCITMMDNSWGTPLFCKPLAMGVDISIHAATKYIVGHADAMMGLVLCREPHYRKLKNVLHGLGYCAAPDDCYLALRGFRTLAVRLTRHWETGLTLAQWLAGRPEVARVLNPALPGDPGHALWQRDFSGACGLFAFALKPCTPAALAAMLDGMRLFSMGFSWGGYESLLVRVNPETMRSATGWAEKGPLLRLHAGLEDPGDLIADLEAGFAHLAAAS
ncbi:MAG TPA: cystathionine beta-lyase [Dongiaceae bacterium]|nr:cystathionine beta-lyase [Dongiaceae bacterium]